MGYINVLLNKFRRSVQDCLKPEHDDHFLLRWLRARKWDAAAAEKMLRDSLEWRKQWDVDNLNDWDHPQLLNVYLPHGVCGYDKDGAPVVIVPFAGLDMYGILHVVSRKEMIKITVKQLESYLNICNEQAKKHGPIAGQITIIFDMEGFNLRQYMWRPAGEVVLALIQMYEANYPEILKICFIINAPKVFTFAFSIAKRFMNEYTLSKIQIIKADPNKWRPAILQLVPADQLPKHFGGSLTDPDGNPRLTTKVCQGGKVPKTMYNNKNEKDKQNDFTTATVKKGEKLKLELPVDESGSILSWEFRTEEHDIKFGILRKTNEGGKTEIIPIHRVSAHQMDEIGIVTCEGSSTYSFVFDNSYSLLRNKKIHYSVRVLPPTNVLEEVKK
ncbi:SEC14-like protein 4 isoform X2 [Leptopilina heterotoma]|uniref:SEC14-like protein 4 isoform X2 n=1 Tax=Leptopilina heterotoma TaxID=63436 RepID=UPI001CA9337C|nr:SEC14-like protein 4 isoform X2 [Leptopilina heterotoma]